MTQERERILKMVAEGKLTVAEADELLEAIAGKEQRDVEPQTTAVAAKKAKYMYVKVASAQKDNVDVRIPLGLLRAGMRFTSLIPPQAMEKINHTMQEKGISFDLNNLKKDDIEDLIQNLTEMEVNVNSKDGDNVRVYCE